MRVVVRSRGVELADASRDELERRARFVLGKYGPKVARAVLKLDRPGGAAPASEVRCLVTLSGTGFPTLTVDHVGDKPFEAAQRALNRAERALARGLEQQRLVF